MKRKISVILVALLLAVSAFALAACGGGIKHSEDWYNALEAYKTADAITLTLTDEVWTYKTGILDSHYKYKTTITFDATAGTASVVTSSRHNDLSGVYWDDGSTAEYYYVLDGTNVIEYYRYVSEYSDDWKSRRTHEFDTADLAMEYLRDVFLNPCDTSKVEFPSFLELPYYDGNMTSTGNPRETKVNKFKNKYTQKYVDDENNITRTYELSFSSGKLSKYHFEFTPDYLLSDRRKTTIKINYSSSLNLPDNLPAEDFYS